MIQVKRVLMIGAFDPGYTRHEVIIQGLQANGIKVRVAAIHKNASTIRRLIHLLSAFPLIWRYQAIVIPAFNQITVPFAWFLYRFLWRRRMLVDYMVGLTDVAQDRGGVSEWKRGVYLAIDRFNLKRTTTMTDSNAHESYFLKNITEDIREMYIVPVGARQSFFDAMMPPPVTPERFLVQYLGSYIPFHGVETIIRAAKILEDNPKIEFELIGTGQTLHEMEQLRDKLNLHNVRFVKKVAKPPAIFAFLSEASCFLGVFGKGIKTNYVVPSKVYECMALGRPVITAESRALAEFFVADEHLIIVPPDDPNALAQAILRLADFPVSYIRMIDDSTQYMRSSFMPTHIGKQLIDILEGASAKPS